MAEMERRLDKIEEKLDKLGYELMEIRSSIDELSERLESYSEVGAKAFDLLEVQISANQEAMLKTRELWFKVLIVLLSGSSIVTFIIEKLLR